MHGLLEAESKTNESFLDNKGKQIDISKKKKVYLDDIVQKEINNALKQEFKKEKDFESFMKKNEKEIRIIKDFIKEKISQSNI